MAKAKDKKMVSAAVTAENLAWDAHAALKKALESHHLSGALRERIREAMASVVEVSAQAQIDFRPAA